MIKLIAMEYRSMCCKLIWLSLSQWLWVSSSNLHKILNQTFLCHYIWEINLLTQKLIWGCFANKEQSPSMTLPCVTKLRRCSKKRSLASKLKQRTQSWQLSQSANCPTSRLARIRMLMTLRIGFKRPFKINRSIYCALRLNLAGKKISKSWT